ncbi:MAG TPA: sensor domain-containing diguanylate cyclase [Nitrospiria bacterium]|nr:sensor domain-containing diguanylate cyclase [Nitrospiria bacterium]
MFNLGRIVTENILLLSIVAVVVGLLAIAGLVPLRRLANTTKDLETELHHLRSQMDFKELTLTQQRQSLLQIKQETANLSRILLLLPDLAKQLSAAHTTRELEENIVQLTQKLLDAREVSLFAVEKDELVLKTQSGFSPDRADAIKRIKIGEGRIGWTAKKRVIMTADDFEKESNLVKTSFLQDRFKNIQTDLCAPLIHWDRFYGVINVGGLGAIPENGRRLIHMISHLGVIALENVLLLNENQKQADLDSLTTLYNVTYFYKYLDRELQKAHRYGRPLTVVIFDLDQFESYNQMFGRLEGDQALRVVANIIRDRLRTVDIPCRYGGEEMAVVLPETDQEKGRFVAERIRQSTEAHPFSLKRVTLSGGLAVYPVDGKDSKDLIKKAEAALGAAKKSGRNRVVSYSSISPAP